MRLALGILLMLSGFSGLTFQVTWMRLIGLSMGGSSASVSAVVAAFFGGLSLGSLFAHRLLRRLPPFRVYLALELTIGLTGLACLPLLLRLDSWMALFPTWGALLPFKFAVAVTLLIVPTACMGATFPVMAEVRVRTPSELGKGVGELYALNTLGAVLGALLSGFVLVPRLGLDGSSVLAAAVNVSAALAGWFLRHRIESPQVASPILAARAAPTPGAAQVDSAQVVAPELPSRRYRVLAVLATTGFVSIVAEICWTKYLVMFLGTTLYGFSAVLSIYLTGVALGAWVFRRRFDAVLHPERWLAFGLLALGLLLLLTRSGLNWVPAVQQYIDARKFSSNVGDWLRYAAVFGLLFPPTLLLGALFPLSVKLFVRREHARALEAGTAYAVNTLAGIVASVLAGLFWIPRSGISTVLLISALLTLFSGAWLLPELWRSRARWWLGALLVLGSGLAGVLPGVNLEALIEAVRQDRFQTGNVTPRPLFIKEGKSGVISASTLDQETANIYDNGLRESVIHLKDPDYGLLMESMLALYPYLLHPNPQSAFVVGLGGGATMRALEFTAIQSIHVVELEPAMRDALGALVGDQRAGLLDPRLTLHINDARNTLLLSEQRYDLLVSQPSHPWRAGASAIFTEQFFELAATRLAPAGIYSQWVNLFRMDVVTLQAILRSFLAVFPHALCIVHQGTADMLLIGSPKPLMFDQDLLSARMREPRVARFLKRWGVRRPSDILMWFGLSRAELVAAAGEGVHSTDTNLIAEVRLARAEMSDEQGQVPVAYLNQFAHFDVVPYLDSRAASTWLFELTQAARSLRGGLSNRTQIADQLMRVDPERAEALVTPASQGN